MYGGTTYGGVTYGGASFTAAVTAAIKGYSKPSSGPKYGSKTEAA